MKVLLNEQGYVVSYALEGDLLDAVSAAADGVLPRHQPGAAVV